MAEGEEAEEDDKYDDSDLSDDMWRLRQMQKQELNKVCIWEPVRICEICKPVKLFLILVLLLLINEINHFKSTRLH